MATMPTPYRSLTDHDLAGAALAHPITLQLTEPVVAALSTIATRDAPATAAERRLLRRALDLIDAAEVALGREGAGPRLLGRLALWSRARRHA
jgi:hypothetical protein